MFTSFITLIYSWLLFCYTCETLSLDKLGKVEGIIDVIDQVVDKKLKQKVEEIAELKTEIVKLKQDYVALEDQFQHKAVNARRQAGGGLGFTAYLDHDVTLGSKQTIVFNKVVTNVGEGYNNLTGIFTCVEPGLYMFTFFVGQRGDHEVRAQLFLNGKNVLDAVAESQSSTYDSQGGNTALLRLENGDAVWINVVNANTHLEGDPEFRFTSFTGFYLYY